VESFIKVSKGFGATLIAACAEWGKCNSGNSSASSAMTSADSLRGGPGGTGRSGLGSG